MFDEDTPYQRAIRRMDQAAARPSKPKTPRYLPGQRFFDFDAKSRASHDEGPQDKPGAVVVFDNRRASPAFYLLETGWVEVSLPKDQEKASLYHDAATHKDSANWLARIYTKGGTFSSEIHPKATFAQVANAVMEHGAYPFYQDDAAGMAGINTVLAVALRSCRCGVGERGLRISRGETNV